jgi:hypothetical protein
MAWTVLRRGSRGRAATAALLSSVVPGLGQLYNREWLKATLMGTGAVGLVLVIKDVLGHVLGMAVSTTGGTGIGAAGHGDPTLQLLAAMALPGVQTEIRQALLPALLGLCALLTWSMIDAYRGARRAP